MDIRTGQERDEAAMTLRARAGIIAHFAARFLPDNCRKEGAA